MAGQLAFQTNDHQQDPDILEFFEELRENIIECYSSLVAAVADSGKT